MANPSQIAFYPPDFKAELKAELSFLKLNVQGEAPGCFLLEQDTLEPAWAQGVWRQVQALSVESIKDAQTKLRAIAPTWRHHGGAYHRRGELIAKGLDLVQEQSLYHFTAGVVKKMPPAFTLIEPNLIYYSKSLSRPSLTGEMLFKEDKRPPSRAYLKLWEALTLLGDWPQKTSQVLDLGSSPGSWTWALAKLGAQVLSVDRSLLSPALSEFKNIQFQTGDAFSVAPHPRDWVFSDVICYPQKLLESMQAWLSSGFCERYVCSIKFAGAPDYAVIDQFRQLPHSRVVHLTHNKNEVTWIRHPKIK